MPLRYMTILLAFTLAGCMKPWALSEDQAAHFHKSLITIDTHDDIDLNFATDANDPGTRGEKQVDLVKMREGNLNTAFFIVYVPLKAPTAENDTKAQQDAQTKLDAINRMTEMHRDQIGLARTSKDIRQLHRDGKMAALIGVENAYGFGPDISKVEAFAAQGMTYGGFAHYGHNAYSDSSIPIPSLGDGEEKWGGLSPLGRDLLAEYNRLGVMADVSHASKAATLEITRLSKAPVIASHSAVYGLNPIPRNLTDEEMIAIADTGGVVQIVAYDTYLKTPAAEKQAAVEALMEAFDVTRFTFSNLTPQQIAEFRLRMNAIHQEWPKANLDDFVAHVDYAVGLIGIDHVGISSDFGGGGGVIGWMDASETQNVTIALARAGYSKRDIAKLWGGNLMRVMDDVQARADQR
ncbi:MAG: membrane dipeptidase [Alphaproteobacteria bacterium]|nr:MAG: membrane dipeptidase [Alphaproteobacteria bacterium]